MILKNTLKVLGMLCFATCYGPSDSSSSKDIPDQRTMVVDSLQSMAEIGSIAIKDKSGQVLREIDFSLYPAPTQELLLEVMGLSTRCTFQTTLRSGELDEDFNGPRANNFAFFELTPKSHNEWMTGMRRIYQPTMVFSGQFKSGAFAGITNIKSDMPRTLEFLLNAIDYSSPNSNIQIIYPEFSFARTNKDGTTTDIYSGSSKIILLGCSSEQIKGLFLALRQLSDINYEMQIPNFQRIIQNLDLEGNVICFEGVLEPEEDESVAVR